MKLRKPSTFRGSVHILQTEYRHDKHGIFDIPDKLVHDGLFALGFTVVPPTPPAKPSAIEPPLVTEAKKAPDNNPKPKETP